MDERPEFEKGRALLARLEGSETAPDRFFAARELVEMGYEPARPVIQRLLEQKAFHPHMTNDLEGFVLGVPWARPLAEEGDYAALAAIFNVDTSGFRYEDYGPLSAKQLAAGAALRDAGEAAIEAVIDAFRENPGSNKLGWLLLDSDDPRATAALEEAFQSEKLDPSIQAEFARRRYADPQGSVMELLSSALSLEEKRKKISFMVRSLGYLRGQIVYCTCGYPAEFLYDDGSQGPIFQLTNGTAVGREWVDYTCPPCGRFIKRTST